MIKYIILSVIILVNFVFIYNFIKDLIRNKQNVKKEPGNPVAMAISQFFIYLLSTFGISDFAIGASIYPKLKWLEAKNLPGTLNTACVIPVFFMSLIYITNIEVGLITLIVPIVCQVIGSYLSPKYVVKLPQRSIKKLVTVGLIVAASVILLSKLNLMPVGGNETSLSFGKLIILGILSFIFGAFNNMGIGSYPLTMATVFALGLNPKVAFPIMMGACTMSVPIGSTQFIKFESYSRKITLFSATFGVLGVFVAAFFVKSLDVSLLQWLALIIIIYAAVSMILSLKNSKN